MVDRLIRLLFTISLIASAGLAPAISQTRPTNQDEAARLRTELVQVQAVVTDKQGRVIEDLKKEDFELLEQGRPQEVSFFSLERIGVRGSLAKAADPVGSEKPSTGLATSLSPTRSIVLFLDTLHLSGPSLIRARLSFKQFVDEQVTDQDTVIIASSSGVFGIVQNPLRNRLAVHRLVERINDFDASGQSNFTPYLAAMVKQGDKTAEELAVQILVSEEGLMMAPLVNLKATEVLEIASYKRRSTLGVLSAIAERLMGMPGQRLLIILSDGFSMRNYYGTHETGDLQATISKAVRSGVVIYSIDSKGLEPPAEFDASRKSVTGGSTMIGRLSSYMSASAKDRQDGINALAQDTGGKAFFNTNDLNGAVRKAVDLTRTYYSLAYYPPDDRGSKEFRRITVRVKHPEYTVRAQKGYFASDLKRTADKELSQTPQQRLVNAIAKPLPVGDIGVSASADYLEVGTDSNQVSLQAVIDGTRLTYREESGRLALELEVAVVVYDRTGKPVHTINETIKGSLAAAEAETAKRAGFRYSRRMSLKPGLYNLRVGFREVGTDQVGTGATWLEVPNLRAGKLTLSSILLAKDSTESTTASGLSGEQAPRALGVMNYRSGSPIVYYMLIYNARDDSDLKMQWEIAESDKVIHKAEWQPVTSRIIGRDGKGIEIGGQLGLPLGPGIYELRISIIDSKSKQPVQRTAVFAVEG